MSSREAMIEEQDQILGDLARLGLAFAEDLRARVALVTKVAEADALGLAFHRVTRSVRLALALRSKLARERHELARLDSRLAEDRAKTRRKQIRTVLINEIYADDDRSQEAADDLAERLDETLDEEALFDRFLEGPVEAGIAHIREELGLAPQFLPQRAARSGGGGSAQGAEPEGVAAPCLSRLQPPQSALLTAPPVGEQLGVRAPTARPRTGPSPPPS
jgi:hypothetical protein